MGVLRMGQTVAEDFDGFYAAHFRDTVAMAYTLTADVGEAQDIAQEAFCRAWRRWSHVGGYENPVAWVRHVAVNLARSRWRRMKTATARLAHLHTGDVPELNPDHVAVVAALRKLPARQREALVLHHIMDLPVNEVAEHFRVPVGTVKSWLHRGRAAIADDLRIDVGAAITPPPVERVKRRSRTRAVVATTLALLAAGAGTYLALHFGLSRSGPVPPVQSPSPTVVPVPSPVPAIDPDDPILKVDWTKTAITFAPIGNCTAGQMRISATNTVTAVSDGKPVGLADMDRIAFGDLDADGKAEAVIPIVCFAGEQSIPDAFAPAVFTRRDDSTIHLATILRGSEKAPRGMWVYSGVLYVHVGLDTPRADDLGELRAYHLTFPDGLTRTGTAPYPPLTDLNLTPLAQTLACGLAPVEPELRLHFYSELQAQAGQREFTILRPNDNPMFAERGRTGLPYLVLNIGCRSSSDPKPNWDSTTVVFDRVGAEWLAVEKE